MRDIAAALVAGLASLGAAIGDAILIAKVVEATVRQPEMGGQLRGLMFLGVGLIEALPILSIVIAFILLF